MNISFLNFDFPAGDITFDYFWLSLKSYVEDNSDFSERINWGYPFTSSDYENVDYAVDEILAENPDIVLASMYVWNQSVHYEVLKHIKKRRPDITIIIGGPHLQYDQPDYFLKHHYIDFCCLTNGYGEPFFVEFLNQYFTDQEWSKVPYLISNSVKSRAEFKKNKFKWPQNIFARNKEYMFMRKELARASNVDMSFTMETSRGCPYACTFCEWGGGTASKMAFKPLDYVLEDLDFILTQIEINWIMVSDSNFGIIKRDIEIAKAIVQKNTGSLLAVNLTGPTKSNKENLYEIEELFIAAPFEFEIKISVQDLSLDVKKNIKRTDMPWEEQFEIYTALAKKYDDRVRLELILGLPGATIEGYYEAYDFMCPGNLFHNRFFWLLLPTTPAAEQSYRDEFDIKTLKMRNHSKPALSSGINSLLFNDDLIESTEIVIGTSSYTTEEWIEMYLMDTFVISFEVVDYLGPITRYLSDNGIPHSTFYKKMYNVFIRSGKYLPAYQQGAIDKAIKDISERVNAEEINELDFIKLPADWPWDFFINLKHLMNLVININRDEFYSAIGEWISDEFETDDKVQDLVRWTANTIKFLEYDGAGTLEYESDYNWADWYYDSSLCTTVEHIKTLNIPQDDALHDNEDMIGRVKKYFLSYCSDYQRSKLFKNVKTTKVHNV